MASEVARVLRTERPRRGAPEETRARLVGAAAELFNRHGYHRVDSNRIAHAAGYAAGTFYKHFAGKRDAFLAAWEAWVTSEWEAIGAELRVAPTREAAAARIVALVLRHHRRWRGLRASMTALVAEDPQVRAFHRAQRRRQLALLRGLRGEGVPAAGQTERDAVLLFTLERVCDAIASGEVRDLGLERARVVELVHQTVAAALAPGTGAVPAGGDLTARRTARRARARTSVARCPSSRR
jgi:AcrR family transcriptional regulator